MSTTLKIGTVQTSKIGPTARGRLEAAGVALPPVVECWLVKPLDDPDVRIGMTLVDDDGPLTVTLDTSDAIVDWVTT